MADSLVYKLQDIKEDRNTNLKPENLKAGVTCLGIEGTLEPNTGSDVEPIYVTSDYTVKTIPVDLNETIDSISTYEDYVVVHTTLNKLKVYNKSNLTEPLMSLDNVSLPAQQFMYIFDKVGDKLYICFGHDNSSQDYYWVANLSTNNIARGIYTNMLQNTQNKDLHIDRVNHLVHYEFSNNYLGLYSYNVETGFTRVTDTAIYAGDYLGNNVYEESKNILIIQSDGSTVRSDVVPSNLNYDVCGLNYLRTKAVVYSFNDSICYIYSLNDDYSLNELLGTVDLSFEFDRGTPIFECLNSNYYYLSYKGNKYILKFNEETNQFSIVLTNENLIVRNSLPYIENQNQYIDFQQGDTEIGIMYNGDQYLTRDKYTGYTNSTLLTGNTMYDIAHQIVAGTMPNNGDVVITPTTQEQTKDKGYYNSLKVSAVTSAIDSNIIPENIKSGVSVLGVEGTLEEGIDTSDATATARDIAMNKIAYTSSGKVTGTGFLGKNIYGALDYTSKTYTIEKIANPGYPPYPDTYIFGKLTIRYSTNSSLMYIYFDGEFIDTYDVGIRDISRSIAVVYYDDEQYIFIINKAEVSTTKYEAISVNFINKTVTDLGEISTIDNTSDIKTTGKECQLGNDYYLYRYQKDTNTFKKYQRLSDITTFTGNNFAIFKYSHSSHTGGSVNKFTYDELSDTYNIISVQRDGVDGVNFYGNKIFINGNVYTLNADLSVGELLAENVYTANESNNIYFLWINEKYVIYDSMLYYWDDTNNTFTEYIPMNYATLNGYSISNSVDITQYTFTNSEEIIGVNINGRDFYFSQGQINGTSDEVLFGKTVYTSGAEVIVGTMPNNGDVTIEPTVEQQTKSSGYYNSLQVNPVTSSIDANILPENIKKDISILGVTGTLEGGIDTSDANATANDMAEDKTAYVNGEKITGTLTVTIPDSVRISEKVKVGTLDTNLYNTYDDTIIRTNAGMCAKNTLIAEGAGLTSDKLVEGNTVLGVEGTAIELKGQTKSITPTINLQTITPDENYNGLTSVEVSAVTSDIDENIKAENIKSGVEILGVTGILEEPIDTSDANATADDIVSPKTAYVNGEKITGALIKTNLQLSDLQEQGIDTSGAISGNNFVTCDNDNTSICIYTPMDLCIGKNSYFPATMSNDYIIKAIGLSADKIVQGNTILGIVGTGGAGTEYEPLSRLSTSVNKSSITQENWVTLSGVVSDTGIVTENETTFVAGTTFTDLANTIGLTADKIKKGETILGITGTYEGIVSQEEYEQAVDTTEQILGINNTQE